MQSYFSVAQQYCVRRPPIAPSKSPCQMSSKLIIIAELYRLSIRVAHIDQFRYFINKINPRRLMKQSVWRAFKSAECKSNVTSYNKPIVQSSTVKVYGRWTAIIIIGIIHRKVRVRRCSLWGLFCVGGRLYLLILPSRCLPSVIVIVCVRISAESRVREGLIPHRIAFFAYRERKREPRET